MSTERVVQLHFGRHVHPIYREQLYAVPPGWLYRSGHPALTDATTPTKRITQAGLAGHAMRFAESAAVRMLSEGGYVHRNRATAQPGDAIIHSAERLLKSSPRPYVMDVEHGSLVVLYQRAALERRWARAAIEGALRDDRLRFVIGWSDAASRSVLHLLPDGAAAELAPKVRTVSPAIRLAAERPRERERGPLRALFVGTAFYEKGGVDAVRALRVARRTHDVTLDLVSFVPDDVATKLAGEPGLTLHAPGGADLVQRLYAQSDVLLFPSHMDTFGWVVAEAMAHGLPVLAPRHLALEETVQDGVSGLLFAPENMLWGADTECRFRHTIPVPRRYVRELREPSPEYVEGVAAVIARLVEDRALHSRLAQGAFASVKSGALSIGRRQELLKEIYDETAAAA